MYGSSIDNLVTMYGSSTDNLVTMYGSSIDSLVTMYGSSNSVSDGREDVFCYVSKGQTQGMKR